MIRWRSGLLTVVAVSLLHLLWGLMFYLAQVAPKTTPTYTMSIVVPSPHILGLALLWSVLLAFVGVIQLLRRESPVNIVFFIPQQAWMMLSAFGIVEAIRAQHYADLVPRAWQFIAIDQAPMLVLVALHLAALWRLFEEWDHD